MAPITAPITGAEDVEADGIGKQLLGSEALGWYPELQLHVRVPEASLQTECKLQPPLLLKHVLYWDEVTEEFTVASVLEWIDVEIGLVVVICMVVFAIKFVMVVAINTHVLPDTR